MQQVLVPNRTLYEDPVFNMFEPVVDRANGGLLAPVREGGTAAAGVFDEFVSAPRDPGNSPSPEPFNFSPLLLEDYTNAGS